MLRSFYPPSALARNVLVVWTGAVLVLGGLEFHSESHWHGGYHSEGQVVSLVSHPHQGNHIEGTETVVVPGCRACLLAQSRHLALTPVSLLRPVATRGRLAQVEPRRAERRWLHTRPSRAPPHS